MPTPTIILEAAPASIVLASNDVAKGNLFGQRLDPMLPSKIYATYIPIKKVYDKSVVIGVSASGVITVDDLGNEGDSYLFEYDFPLIGTVTLGQYETQSTDTTTTILAASIADELNNNSYGFTFSSDADVIVYEAPSVLGGAANGTAIECTYTPLFNPSTIADLWTWYDAGSGVSGTSTVTAWTDKTGNGNDLASVSGTEPELVLNAQNNKPAIAKGVIDAAMVTSSFVPDLSTQGGTIFIVGKQSPTEAANRYYFDFGSSQFMGIRRMGATANTNRFTVNSQSGTVNNDFSGVTDGVFHSLRLRVDNVNQYGSINNSTEQSATCVLGNYAGGSILQMFFSPISSYSDKSICEFLLYNRSLTPTEIGQVEAYLNTKYNLY